MSSSWLESTELLKPGHYQQCLSSGIISPLKLPKLALQIDDVLICVRNKGKDMTCRDTLCMNGVKDTNQRCNVLGLFF